MAAGQFKAHCLRVLDEVRARREPVVITKKGVPVAKLVPADDASPNVFGCMAGTADIGGDIEAPVVSARTWKAAR
jgi:prevent-host-death family protein